MQEVFQDKDVIGSEDEEVPELVSVHYLCSILSSIIAFCFLMVSLDFIIKVAA